MQLHVIKDVDHYFYKVFCGFVSCVRLDDLIICDMNSTINDVMSFHSNLFIGLTNTHIVCVKSSFTELNYNKIDGSTKIKDIHDNNNRHPQHLT